MNIKKIEDIYPLTIVNRRYAGWALIQAESDCECVGELQWNEDWSYGDSAEEKMDSEWSYICYGLGCTIDEAFEDFLKRKKREEDQPKRDYENNPLTPEEQKFAMKIARAFAPPVGLDLVPVQDLGLSSGVVFYLDPMSGNTQ